MKNNTLIILFFTMILTISCKEKVDYEKEKTAIIQVLEAETEAFFDKDIDRLASYHIQDESNIRLTATKSGYTYDVGWDKIESFFLDYFENVMGPGEYYEVKKNYKIKIYDESAWAAYDNFYYNSDDELLSTSIHTQILEKVNGEWKIVFYTSIYNSTWEEEVANGQESNAENQ
jgi:hypothetical protein